MTGSVEQFRKLHENTMPLRLPNAWDAGSARLFESQGASAIATTSAGVAWVLGYRDGGMLPVDELMAAVARMARILTVPLSIDIEEGYSETPGTVADNVMRLVDLGVAGINIEDGADAADALVRKIEAIRSAASKAGVDLFVNARCDVFLRGLVPEPDMVREAIARAWRYAGAGADGMFLPALYKPDEIKAVVEDVAMPLNLMAWPGLGDAEALGKLGVRRLSAGGGIAQAAWSPAEKLGRHFLQDGSSEPMQQDFVPYSRLQELFPGS